jgi:hypothetical protein
MRLLHTEGSFTFELYGSPPLGVRTCDGDDSVRPA